MDIFKEDRALFKSGAVLSAFKWSLVTYPILSILTIIGFLVLAVNILLGLLLFIILPNVVLFLIYYFALKRGISRFDLKTYSLRVEYVGIITAFVFVYDILVNLIFGGELRFPTFGIVPIVIMLLVPYFVKE